MDHETDRHPARRRRKPGEPDQGGCTGAVADAACTPVPQTGMTQFYAELYERVAFVCANTGPRKWHFAFSSKPRGRASRGTLPKGARRTWPSTSPRFGWSPRTFVSGKFYKQSGKHCAWCDFLPL